MSQSIEKKLSDQYEYFDQWKEKYIELINVINTFLKSKYLETKEDFESLKSKIVGKKKEHVSDF